MSRSDYYPRKRARIQPREQKPTIENTGEGRPRRIGACAVCNAHLPIISHDGLLYVQAPLGFVCKAVPPQVCPWLIYLETGADGEVYATFPSADVRSAIHPA